MEFTEKISVVMPSYNTPLDILKEAVDSILNQTFRDYEFIIVDDCSTDDSATYLRSLTDRRIKLIRNPNNLGITKSLNVGLRNARGKYIARMDSDDIALPERFEKQYAYMESHPNCVMCGCKAERFGAETGPARFPVQDMDLYKPRLMFFYPGPMHPTIFLRHETLLQNHLTYDEDFPCAQDYRLYTQIVQYGDVAALPEILMKYRIHKKQISTTHWDLQTRCAKSIQKEQLENLLGEVTEEELDMHYIYSSGYYVDKTICDGICRWYNRLVEANDQKGIYDRKKFRETIIFLKKRLVRQTIRQGASWSRKIHLCFHYLPPIDAVKTLIKNKSKPNARK